MIWILLTIVCLANNIHHGTATCTHENNFGVYFIYCEHLNSLDEIDSNLYETNPIRVFIKTSSLALKRSNLFKGMFLKELEVIGSKISVIEPNFLDSLHHLGTFTIQDCKVDNLEAFPELPHLYRVKFFGNEILHVPDDFMLKLRGLYAATFNNIRSDLKHLPSNFLKDTPVQYLQMENVGLETLQPDSLHTLTKLISLSLSFNKIKNLPNYVFKDLGSLNDLNLSGNGLSDLDKNVFVGLVKLEELHLASNQFSQVDSTWFENLPALTFLDLHSNKIKNFNIAVPTLKSLDLSDNDLIQLKDELFTGVPMLNFLDLSSNLITHISPDAFKDLYHLEVLNLEGNKISKLNSDIYRHFSNFTCFLLSNNKITDLNDIEFDHLESLLSLNLSHNNIKKLSKNAFRKLYSLEELDLHNSFLTDIKPEMFYGLERLVNLNLSSNPLSKLESGVFKAMPGLQVLTIGNVGLSSVPADTFLGLPTLKVLDLQYNALTDLPEGLLKYSKFAFISLRGNKIENLSASVFFNQTQIEELDLRSTGVQNLDVVEELPNLRYLLLKDTKFEKKDVIFFKTSTFRKINEDYWDSWCPEFIPECKRD